MSRSSWPHGLQHTRLLCPSRSLRICSNSCPLSQWCCLTISSSVALFSFCLQSFPPSGSFSVHYITIQKQIWYWHTLRMALVVKNLPENAGYIRDAGSVTGSGKFPGEGHGNSLQYSCLENPMDRGAWWATVHGVTKHQTCLKHWCGDGRNIIWLLLHFSILMAFPQFLRKILVPTENIAL